MKGLNEILSSLIPLKDCRDRWRWDMGNDQEYMVQTVAKKIDDNVLANG